MAKKYKCPYCQDRHIRKDLIDHIDKEHEELIPEGTESAQVVYDLVNGTKGAGRCRVCGSPTKWNSNAKRYDVLCENPRCKQKMREEYQKNMLRVHGTYNILNDDEQQKKMLANRSISGTYKFTDGGVVTYTGSYEKKFLEFADKVMLIPSKDIMAPGPTLEYEMNGEKHFYITDFLYIPYNLIIEVKDGGSNPNNKDTKGMRSSRQRTIEKEKLITDRGEFNYLRLTDNQFVQLLEIFMEIKKALMEGNDSKIVRINESHHIPNTDPDDRYNVYCKTIKALEDNNIKSKISKKSIDDFVNCVETDFGYDLCISVGVDNVKKATSVVNAIIKPYGGKLRPDNYGTVFLSLNESTSIFPSGWFDEYKEDGERRLKEIKDEEDIINESSIMYKAAEFSTCLNTTTLPVYIAQRKVIKETIKQSKSNKEAIENLKKLKNKFSRVKIWRMNHGNIIPILDKKSKEIIFNHSIKIIDKEIAKLENVKESYISESRYDQNLTKFTAYHLEPKVAAKNKKKPIGGWDEELYSKDIPSAINNDIKYNYECKNYTKVSAYVYTAGRDLKAIYLGTITIFDKNNPNDWEWEEQEFLDKKTYDYLKKNPIAEATDISNFYDDEDYE